MAQGGSADIKTFANIPVSIILGIILGAIVGCLLCLFFETAYAKKHYVRTGILTGMTRTTKRKEIVRAALDCIAYQITDVFKAMSTEFGIDISELRVDGGPTKNKYLMQFQSDIAHVTVQVPSSEELSGIGVVYAAGIAAGIYNKKEVLNKMTRTRFTPQMQSDECVQKYAGWKNAVEQVLNK